MSDDDVLVWPFFKFCTGMLSLWLMQIEAATFESIEVAVLALDEGDVSLRDSLDTDLPMENVTF